MFMLEYRAISWWYWLAAACFLASSVSGWPTGFLFVIGIAAFQLIHFILLERSMMAFSVQVRLGYLLAQLLFLALHENLQWIYWVPTIGTWATVLFGYCPMARIVSLMPWNRKEAFSLGLLKRTFLSTPVRWNILQGS
jgi:hypothetical protein